MKHAFEEFVWIERMRGWLWHQTGLNHAMASLTDMFIIRS